MLSKTDEASMTILYHFALIIHNLSSLTAYANILNILVIFNLSLFCHQLHDVGKYEVRCSQFPSLWSILEIHDIQVANTLLDLCKVESILLIPRSEQAGDLLKDKEQ